jgi:release factor glutamine methyltransferase
MNCLQELKLHYGDSEGYAIYRLVMEECFGLSHADILLGKDNQFSEENKARLSEITGRLLKNEPVQYVLGHAVFLGHDFVVRPGVLIPRPETEDLVSFVLSLLPQCIESPKVLDIGTGSGCIAVSLALRGCRVTAFDVSETALEVAAENAQRNNAEVVLIHENILHPSSSLDKWDIIVSNPPYVCTCEAHEMDDNVLMYEPHIALFVPDSDPLVFYRAIASYALSHLNPGGHICLEINEMFSEKMQHLLASFGFSGIRIINDRYEKKRFAYAHL